MLHLCDPAGWVFAVLIQFASDSIGVPACTARRCMRYFQMINCFHKFDGLMVNIKPRRIKSCPVLNRHFKFLLCNFWLTYLVYYPLGGAAVHFGRICYRETCCLLFKSRKSASLYLELPLLLVARSWATERCLIVFIAAVQLQCIVRLGHVGFIICVLQV